MPGDARSVDGRRVPIPTTDMLSLIVFLPLLGAIVTLLAGGRGDRPEREPLVRNVALATSLATFAATLVMTDSLRNDACG